MERRTFCPICGAEARAAASCAICGSAPDVEIRAAVGLDRIRRARAMTRLVLLAALVWWAAALWRGLAPEGTLVPAAVAIVALAESVWQSAAEGRLTRERAKELREAQARLSAAEGSAALGGSPAPAGAAESPSPGAPASPGGPQGPP